MTVWQIKVSLSIFWCIFDGVHWIQNATCDRKNIPSNHFLEFSLHFISVIKTALSITCRLWSAKLQHRTKNSSDSNSLRDMFSSFCPETISISWSCCLSLPVFILLPVPYICLYQTLACIPMTQEYFAVIWHWWGQMAAYVYLHSIFIVRSRIVDRVEKRVGHKSGLRISLWKCERAYYWNFDVNLAVKGHKDTTEIQYVSCRQAIGAAF